jgi:hypothetical protein
MILTRKLALGVAGVVAAGVLGTAGVAAATSETGTPTPAASSAPSSSAPTTGTAKDTTKKKHKAARAALGRGLHGEWVVAGKDGKPVTLVSIRGQVTAVGPAGVTVKAEDGFTSTYTVTADTKVRGAGATKLTDVKVGAKGAMIGVKSGNTATARTVLVRK